MKTKVRTLFRTLFFDYLNSIAQRTTIYLSKLDTKNHVDAIVNCKMTMMIFYQPDKIHLYILDFQIDIHASVILHR